MKTIVLFRLIETVFFFYFLFYLDERAARGNEEEKDESKADIEQSEKLEYVCMMNKSTRCDSIVILTDIQPKKHHVSVCSRKSMSI
jgi:hypothetical protein